jgi:hypothetical protein
MSFPIRIEIGTKAYTMTVDRYYIGDSIDKYKVSAGEKEIHLQSNIPEIENTGAKKKIAWKILTANYNIGSSDDAALGIQRLFREIELEILPRKRPSFIPNKKDDKPRY